MNDSNGLDLSKSQRDLFDFLEIKSIPIGESISNERDNGAKNEEMDVEANELQTEGDSGSNSVDPLAKNLEDFKRYSSRFKILHPRINSYKKAINEKEYGTPPEEKVTTAFQELNEANSKRFEADSKQDYVNANQALDDIESALEKMEEATREKVKANDREKRRIRLLAEAEKLTRGVNAHAYDDLDEAGADFLEEKNLAIKGLEKSGDDLEAADKALDDLEGAITTLRAAAAGKIKEMQDKLKPNQKISSEIRSRAKTFFKADPGFFDQLAKQRGGMDVIDAVVEDVGGSAKSEESKTLVKAALVVRFGLSSLEGDLTTKALPRLYKVLKLVPDTHTKDNVELNTIVRNQQNGTSSWTGGAVVLNSGRTGIWGGRNNTYEFGVPDETDDPKKDRVKSGKVKEFDSTTLHEVGHAVDANIKFMKTNGANESYGGWQTHKVDDLVPIVSRETGFEKAFASVYPIPFLRRYVKARIRDVDPETEMKKGGILGTPPDRNDLLSDAGILQAVADREGMLRAESWDEELGSGLVESRTKMSKQPREAKQFVTAVLELMLGASSGPNSLTAEAAVDFVLGQFVTDKPIDWEQLKGHFLTEWSKAVQNDFWQQGAEGAQKYQLGGRVYSRRKDGWVSYLASARSSGVSNYQFAAAPEWFAELYSAFVLKKLPKGHKDFGWLDQLHKGNLKV